MKRKSESNQGNGSICQEKQVFLPCCLFPEVEMKKETNLSYKEKLNPFLPFHPRKVKIRKWLCDLCPFLYFTSRKVTIRLETRLRASRESEPFLTFSHFLSRWKQRHNLTSRESEFNQPLLCISIISSKMNVAWLCKH